MIQEVRLERMVPEETEERREPEMTRCLWSVGMRDRSSVPSVHPRRVCDLFATFILLLLHSFLHHFVLEIYPVNNDIEIFHTSLVLISIPRSLINC